MVGALFTCLTTHLSSAVLNCEVPSETRRWRLRGLNLSAEPAALWRAGHLGAGHAGIFTLAFLLHLTRSTNLPTDRARTGIIPEARSSDHGHMTSPSLMF
jgi:hypothetical protein